MKITDHKLSEGIALTFRVPEGNMKHPLIILCHGFCGIRNVLLPCFANAFTEAGFATITFDYRGFGESEGERGRLVPAMQIEDIISVINWQKSRHVLIISVSGYGEHRWVVVMCSVQLRKIKE